MVPAGPVLSSFESLGHARRSRDSPEVPLLQDVGRRAAHQGSECPGDRVHADVVTGQPSRGPPSTSAALADGKRTRPAHEGHV